MAHAVYRIRSKALEIAKERGVDESIAGMAVTKEVETILAKKGDKLFELMLAVSAGDKDAVRARIAHSVPALSPPDIVITGRTCQMISCAEITVNH